MKKLLLKLIVCSAALLPFTQVHAAPAGKTFGTFAPKTKFTLTVSEVISAKATLTGASKKAPVPNGVPKFKEGQKVKFVIGEKGELKGPGFTIKFQADSITSNAYVNKPKKGSTVQADVGSVFKDLNNQPTGVALSFFKSSGSGLKTSVHSVYYTFN